MLVTSISVVNKKECSTVSPSKDFVFKIILQEYLKITVSISLGMCSYFGYLYQVQKCPTNHKTLILNF